MVSANQLVVLFKSDEPFVLLDTRETAIFARGHILGSTNIPLSFLEASVESLIPDFATKIILAADDDRTVEFARAGLESLGYQNILDLQGGVAAWALAGYVLFSGTNVLSKAFGEYIEDKLSTPCITAQDLKNWQDTGKPFLLLDGRTPHEHNDYCIPGAFHCANGDLPLITETLRSNPELPVVVHCAGRTRSIIGSQVLRDSDLENPVYALKNGTIDWVAAGYPLEFGVNRPFLSNTKVQLESSVNFAKSRLRDYGIVELNLEQVGKLTQSCKTVYLFDIRSAAEYEYGSLGNAQNVAGGQLVQTTDQYIAVRNSAIVLCDDDHIRATYVAIWLKRMGWRNIYTHSLDKGNCCLQKFPTYVTHGDTITGPELAGKFNDTSICIVDLRRSPDYVQQHIPGAQFFLRQPGKNYDCLPLDKTIVLVAHESEKYTSLVAGEIVDTGRKVQTLTGGMQDWVENRFPVESDNHRFLCHPVDVSLSVEDYQDYRVIYREGKRYLNWEIELLDLLENEPAAMFSTVPIS